MQSFVEKMTGVICPIVTPLKEDESLDEKGLRRLVNHLLRGGVNGVFVLGTSGELPTLTDRVRLKAVEVVVDEVRGRVPVLAGAGEAGTKRSIELARTLSKIGVQGLVVCPPYYFQSNSQSELIDHFAAVAGSIELPVMIYNIPQTTKTFIEAETVEVLSRIDNIVGVKDSSGDFTHFQELLMRFRKEQSFRVFQGAERLSGISVLYGADGVVAGLSNVAPRLVVDLYLAAKSGNIGEVFRLQEKLNHLFKIHLFGSWLSGLKTSLEILGICGGRVSAPIFEVKHHTAEIKRILEECELFPGGIYSGEASA